MLPRLIQNISRFIQTFSVEACLTSIRTRTAGDKLLSNMGWLGGSQVLGKLLRLATVIVVARLLSPSEYGLAAIVLATNEFILVLGRQGTVSKLIQVDADKLADTANTAYRINWILCIILFLLQLLIAHPVAEFYDNANLVLPIMALGFGYLIMPLGMVQAAFNIRANNLHVVARSDGLQMLVDAACTVILAILGFGVWALVLPKLIAIPVWVLVHQHYSDWRPGKHCGFRYWRQIVNYSKHIVGVDLLMTLRNNVDYLLVGKFLGVEALGIYYFAFNAGAGITLGLINAFSTAMYPYLCEVRNNHSKLRVRFLSGLKKIAWITIPIILLQSMLAPWYVPLVYGDKWAAAGAVPVLILICLSAITRPFAEASGQLLRAVGEPHIELAWNMIFTALLVIALMGGIAFGIAGVAASLLICHLVFLPMFSLWVMQHVFMDSINS